MQYDSGLVAVFWTVYSVFFAVDVAFLGYILYRYRLVRSWFNLALFVGPFCAACDKMMRMIYVALSHDSFECDTKLNICTHDVRFWLFLAVTFQLLLTIWKAYILKPIMIKWNDTAAFSIAGIAVLVLLGVSGYTSYARIKGFEPGSLTILIFAYSMIFDIIFILLIIFSLRKYQQGWKQFNQERASLNLRCQLLLGASLFFITFFGSINSVFDNKMISTILLENGLTVQFLTSYYFFYNVTRILVHSAQPTSNKKDASEKSSSMPSTKKAAQFYSGTGSHPTDLESNIKDSRVIESGSE